MRVLIFVSSVVFSIAAAAGDVKATVSASASVDVLPTSLEVILTIKQHGPDAKAAAAALKTSRDAALAKLAVLGAIADRVQDEAPTVVEKGDGNPMQKAMAAARMAAGGNRLKRTPKNDEPQEVQLQQVMRVPVPLAGKDLAAIVVQAETIKATVRASKPLPEPPDTAEEGDDDESVNYQALAMGIKKRGPIHFEYSAARTSALEQQALTEALKSAQEKAKLLAAAAGMKGATVVSIASQGAENANVDSMSQYVKMMTGAAAPSKISDRISGEAPGLSVTATLTVEFLLVP